MSFELPCALTYTRHTSSTAIIPARNNYEAWTYRHCRNQVGTLTDPIYSQSPIQHAISHLKQLSTNNLHEVHGQTLKRRGGCGTCLNHASGLTLTPQLPRLTMELHDSSASIIRWLASHE